jgi:hypothetical protein
MGASGAPLEAFWKAFWGFLEPPGPSWEPPGSSRGVLGPPGALWALLELPGASWVLFWKLLVLLGASWGWCLLGLPGGFLGLPGTSWCLLEPSWGVQGLILKNYTKNDGENYSKNDSENNPKIIEISGMPRGGATRPPPRRGAAKPSPKNRKP